MASGILWTGGTQSLWSPRGTLRTRTNQSFQPPGTPWTGGPFGPQVPCGLAGLSPFGHQVLCGHAGLSPFRLQLPCGPTDSVLLGPQVPCGLAGLSPFSHPGTLWTGGTQSFRPPDNLGTGRHGRTCHQYIYIYCVYIPWRPSTVRLVRAKCKKRGLVPTCIYLSFFFIKTICNVLNMIRVYVFNTAVYD